MIGRLLRYALAVITLSSAGQAFAESNYNLGREAYGRADYAEAKRLWSDECAKGHAKSCTGMGLLYKQGYGVARDLTKSAQFFQKGCETKSGYGCRMLGIQFDQGSGIDQNPVQAAYYYRLGCAQEDYEACVRLGKLHETGRGAERNITNATGLYRRGCDNGVGMGCAWLAELYASGTGVSRSAEVATHLRKQACSAGYTQSCQVAQANAKPSGSAPSTRQTPTAANETTAQQAERLIERYEKTVERGERTIAASNAEVARSRAQNEKMRQAVSNANDTLANLDKLLLDTEAQMASMERSRIKLADTAACAYTAGECTPPEQTPRHDAGAGLSSLKAAQEAHRNLRFKDAMQYYDVACMLSNMAGCVGKGLLYRSGHGVAKNAAIARRYFDRACKAGLASACAERDKP